MTVGSKVKQTLASLKGAESVLRIYSAQTKNEEEREVYTEAVEMAGSIIKDLESRIKKLEYEEPQYKG